jgi:hypothetical protein
MDRFEISCGRISCVGIFYWNWLQAGRPRGWSSIPGSVKNFLYVGQIGSGADPASYSMGTGALSPGVKPSGREADNSPPTSAEVKKTSISTSTPLYAFMA